MLTMFLDTIRIMTSTLMWPFHIGRNGAVEPLPMALPPRAQREFDSLVEQKKTEAAAIEDEI